jgi:hypothetical protein
MASNQTNAVQGKTPPYVEGSTTNGATTPVYGATTPVYGATTPVYGATTPVYGATTPVYGATTNGATTPVYGATTNGATTPVYGATTPKYGSTTPKYGATTNAATTNAAKTPMYGNTGLNTFKLNAPAVLQPYPNQTPPFYNEVTPIKIEYTTDQGFPNSVDLPLVTLPAGTLLFRGVTIPDIEGKEDVRYFYRDYIGDPYGKDQVCLTPTHNVFFYPFPYVSFGAHNIGKTFKCIQIVVLIKPMTVVSAIGPYRFVRAQTWIYTGDSPFKRCSLTTLRCKEKATEEEVKRAKEAAQYDSCLDPDYQKNSGTRGWMALAQLDTLKPNESGELSTMGKYIVGLSKRIPKAASELIAFMYKDFYSPMKYKLKDKEVNLESSGYPEIALYPYSKHPGDKTIIQYCNDSKSAESIITDHAKRDDLNFLPLAMITRKGILNVIGGENDYFSYDRIQANASILKEGAEVQQHTMEKMLDKYLTSLKKDGLTLPYYGTGKLKFDTRTGFFVLPQLVSDPVYQGYLLQLDSVKAEHASVAYSIMVRNYSKENMGTDIVINPEVKIPRSFIFSRPASMMNIVKVLKVSLPGVYLEYLAKGSELFKKEGSSNKALQLYLPPEIQKVKVVPSEPSGYGYGLQPGYKTNVFSPPSPVTVIPVKVGNSVSVIQGDLAGLTGVLIKRNEDGTFLLKPSAESAAALGLSEEDELEVRQEDIKAINKAQSPAYYPSSPQSPAYHPKTPESPPYHPRTPEGVQATNSPPYRPRTPLKGGTRSKKKITRKGKKVTMVTRKKGKRTTRKKEGMNTYKSVFTNIWKLHADRKYKSK